MSLEEKSLKHILQPGTVLDDKYEITGLLGQGGFGITYVAENKKLGSKLAIKELYIRAIMGRDTTTSNDIFLLDLKDKEDFEKSKESFLAEARTIGRFSSFENVVHVVDHFEANETAYIVMEFIAGSSLKDDIKKNGPKSAKESFESMLALMKDLDKIHKKNIIHRDISPDNIMVTDSGKYILSDFGASREYAAGSNLSKVVKEGYAPVEQVTGKGEQGPWTDIYALCATIYEMITGQAPESSVSRLFYDEIKTPSQLGFEIEPELEKILMKGLSVQAADRYQSLSEMAADIREVIKPEVVSEGKKNSKKPVLLIGIIAGILVAAAAVLIVLFANKKPKFVYNPQRDYKTTIMSSDLTMPEFTQVKKVIIDRLNVFAGEGNYLLEDNDDGMYLYIPKALYHGEDYVALTKTLLTRPAKMYLVNKHPSIQSRDLIKAITSEDIADIQLKNGLVAEADNSNLKEDESYDYIQITLTDAGALKLKEIETDEWDEALYLYQDRDLEGIDSHFGFKAVKSEDKHTVYVIMRFEEPAENVAQTVFYNWTHESFNKPAGVKNDFDQRLEWEIVDGADYTGRNQVDRAEINEDWAIVVWEYDNYKDASKGEVVDTEEILKNRLDALGQPYAFGWYDMADRRYYGVITSASRLGQGIIDFIDTERYLYNKTCTAEIFLSDSDDKVSVINNGDGTYSLEVKYTDDYNRKTLQNTLEYMKLNGEKEMILQASNHAILITDINSISPEGTIIYNNCFSGEKITDENVWMLNLVKTVCEADMHSMTFYAAQGATDEQDYGISEAEDIVYQPLIEEISALDDRINAYMTGDRLNVYLHLDYGNDLPEQAIKSLERIWDIVDIKSRLLNDLYIKFTDTDSGETAAVLFFKNNAYLFSGDDLFEVSLQIYHNGGMIGGKFKAYTEQFDALMDEFLNSKGL